MRFNSIEIDNSIDYERMEINMKKTTQISPQNAKGTRDFGPHESLKREYIINIMKTIFIRYGLCPLETPAIENLSTLTGKYGEEGDKLLFKILNSGDYLKNISEEKLTKENYKSISTQICERGLKYDLTIPFARFVSQNYSTLTFPFKRYQIQPVWRADRPQKGRYREFYQSDADIIGTKSLLAEIDLLQIFNDVFNKLKIQDIEIKINHRKILEDIAKKIGLYHQLEAFTAIIDKLDKIGKEKVFKELEAIGLQSAGHQALLAIFNLSKTNEENLHSLANLLGDKVQKQKGVQELLFILDITKNIHLKHIKFDPTLARGLDYYTGTIFEVKIKGPTLGSLGGGGRYDDLTSIFGIKDLSGVGISFGLERIYDLMNERNLFESLDYSLDYMIVNFSEDLVYDYHNLSIELRSINKSVEIYPEASKIKKQMNYANKKNISNVIFLGEDEKKAGIIRIKHMKSGNEKEIEIKNICQEI